MVIGLLVAGAVLVVGGLAAIGFGIPIRDFGLGSTLMVTGVTALCGGAIVLAVAAAVRELQTIARRLGSGVPAGIGQGTQSAPATSPRAAPDVAFPPLTRDQPSGFDVPPPPPAPPTAPSASPPPWHEEVGQRTGARGEAPPPAPPIAPPAEAPKRRNLLFSSTSRKERERAQARTAEPLPPDLLSADLRPNPPAVPPAAEPSEPAPATFDDAWPKSERPRSVDVAPRRPSRPLTPPSDTNGTAPSPAHPPAPVEQPPVTVLKSGVVDGMAYSLYSDGSIEAQMPEGMMRFASIDELRSHLDHRS
ncbi:DUF308 domain-containing protein [Bradyrhizobium jicamae]|uniref:DUF308 domain-containing protein n=1 Tax=Bradyrhizobium jicamae TaxID=280332 RepID=UPI001BA45027|nr:DUF308 domain-containing protein [Bradyrhizobium jicamae]MBR0754466.1 DUF308 domain-containing protein [Bradyrhizobium jicamae]